jgi:cephalosporin hydroxylase
MVQHWRAGVNFEALLTVQKPKLVLELGAAVGQNTMNLFKLSKTLGYQLITVDDHCSMMDEAENYKWITGVSYEVMKTLPKSVVDFCLLDTDHNSWTVTKEIETLLPLMSDRGMIAFHDTEVNRYNNGAYGAYSHAASYPAKEIAQDSRSYTDAIIESMDSWNLFTESREFAGVMVYSKKVV